MFIPHVAVHKRRDGRKATPRQRLAGVAVAVAATLVSALITAATSGKGSRVDATVLAALVAGAAVAVGIVLARTIGRRGRL